MFTGANGTGKTRILAALMASLGNLNELQDRVRQDAATELEVRYASGCGRESTTAVDPLTWRYRDGDEDRTKPNFATQLSLVEETQGAPECRGASGCWAMAGTGSALLQDAEAQPGTDVQPARIAEALTLSAASPARGIAQRLLNLRTRVALERDANDGSPKRLTGCLRALEEAIAEITGQQFSLVIKPGRNFVLMAEWGGVAMFPSELPDGLRSLLNWLGGWVVLQAENYEESDCPLREPVILILDEPENHLHPAWQRRALPAVQSLFPNAQLFVVTHSPFVVSSLSVGWIHKFARREDGLIEIADPTPALQGDTYLDAVEDVLGLLPIERFDPESQRLLEEFTELLTAVARNEAPRAELDRLADALRARGGEVASVTETELYQLDSEDPTDG